MKKASGFTLVELMISMTMSAFMFAAVTYSAVSLQESFSATEQYSQANSDEQRALDYISRDARECYAVSTSTDSQSITMTLPDCYGGNYDAQGNPLSARVKPAVSGGIVNYGTSTLSVTYYVSGQNLIRQQTVSLTGSTSQLVISGNVENLQAAFKDLTSMLEYSITFMPQFVSTSGMDGIFATERAGTTLTACTSIRNVRRD